MTSSAWVGCAEATLVAALRLQPLEVPSSFARRDGRWREQPVTLVTRAYRGPGVAYGRVVQIHGHGLEIHNLLFVPSAGLHAPVLGVDLVDVGRPERVVVADASWATGGNHAPPSAFPLAGPLPSWCARFFSPTPVFARVTAEQFEQVRPELDARVSLFIEAVRSAAPFPPVRSRGTGTESETADNPTQSSTWTQAYLDAHRTEDRGLALMEKMFGAQWTQAFLEEALFPVRCPGG